VKMVAQRTVKSSRGEEAKREHAAIYDLACKPCEGRALQRITRSRDLGQSWGTQALGGISRLRFFSYFFIGCIFYSQFYLPKKLALGLRPSCNFLLFLDFLPSYFFATLSSFSWLCWIAQG
jgi:hypothetical protein